MRIEIRITSDWLKGKSFNRDVGSIITNIGGLMRHVFTYCVWLRGGNGKKAKQWTAISNQLDQRLPQKQPKNVLPINFNQTMKGALGLLERAALAAEIYEPHAVLEKGLTLLNITPNEFAKRCKVKKCKLTNRHRR